jgi:hypothetical protein
MMITSATNKEDAVDIIKVNVPARFWEDHLSRSDTLNRDEVEIAFSKREGFTVELTRDQADNLVSDADYYVECGSEMGPDYFGLVSSARATLKRLAKVGVTL